MPTRYRLTCICCGERFEATSRFSGGRKHPIPRCAYCRMRCPSQGKHTPRLYEREASHGTPQTQGATP